MPKLHNCLKSTLIESMIFKKTDNFPDQDCPICCEKLIADSPNNNCCCPYVKELRCGHYVHVACQIDYNPDFRRCPICRTDLIEQKN